MDRNLAIFQAHAAKKSLRQIGLEHNISGERVRQILKTGAAVVPSLAQLPGTEDLSPITRGLLIRMGYVDAAQVRADVFAERLTFGCTFGMGRKRFDEIEHWARGGQDYRP